ncbi:titin-like [Microplitis mediator]|uniref:titin-like n=1 Tax=Microplitis mediator TaxID=375433 RepID=UPI0025548072|nr:titin-like [Microplitis mediator]
MSDIKKTSVTIHDSITSLMNFMNDLQIYVDDYRNDIKKDYKKYLSKLPKDMSESLHDQYERIDMLYNKFNKLLNKFSVAIAEDYTDILTVGTEINGLRQKYQVMVAELNNFITSQYKDGNYSKNVKNKIKEFEKVVRKHNKLVVTYNNQIERLNTFNEHLKMNVIMYTSNHKRKYVIPVDDYAEEFESLIGDDTYKARGQVISRYLKEMVGKLNNASPGFPLIPIAKLEKIDFHDNIKAEDMKIESDYDLEYLKGKDVGTEWNQRPKDFKGKEVGTEWNENPKDFKGMEIDRRWNENPKDFKGKEMDRGWNKRPKVFKGKKMGKEWNERLKVFKGKEVGTEWNESLKDFQGREMDKGWDERPKDFKDKEMGKEWNESPKDFKDKEMGKEWNEDRKDKNPKSNENEEIDRSTEMVSIKTEPEETMDIKIEADELHNFVRRTKAPEDLTDYYNIRDRMWDIPPVGELSAEEVNNILEEEDRRKQLASDNKPFEKTENDYYKEENKDLRKITEQNTNLLPKNEPYSDDQSLSSMDSLNEQNFEENEDVITNQFESGRSVEPADDTSGGIGPNSSEGMIKKPVQLRKPKPEVQLTRPLKMRRIDSFDYGENEILSQAELEQYLSGSFENDNQFKEAESRPDQKIKSLQEEMNDAEQYSNIKVEQTEPSSMPKVLESKDSFTKLPINRRHPADDQSSSSMDSRNEKYFESDPVVKTEFPEDSESAPPGDETEKISRESLREITGEILKEIENRRNFEETENVIANKSEEGFGVEKADDMPEAIPAGTGSLSKKPVQLRKEKPKEELIPRLKKQRTDRHNYEEESFENDNQSSGTSDSVIEPSVLVPNNQEEEEEVEDTEVSDQEDEDENVEMTEFNSRLRIPSNKMRKSKTIDVKKYIDLLKSSKRKPELKSKIIASILEENKPEYSYKIKTQYADGSNGTSQLPTSDLSDDSQRATEKLPPQTEDASSGISEATYTWSSISGDSQQVTEDLSVQRDDAPSEISDKTFSSFSISEDSPQVTEKLSEQTEEAPSETSEATYSPSSISDDSQLVTEKVPAQTEEAPSEISNETYRLSSISDDSQQVTEKVPAQTEEAPSEISNETYSLSSISNDSQLITEKLPAQTEEAPSEISNATYSPSSLSNDSQLITEKLPAQTEEAPSEISNATYSLSSISDDSQQVTEKVPAQTEQAPSEISNETYSLSSISGDSQRVTEDFVDQTGENRPSSVATDDSATGSVDPEVPDQVPQNTLGSEISKSKILLDDSSSLSNESSSLKQRLRRKRLSEPTSIIRKKLHGKKSKSLQQSQKPVSENQTLNRKRVSKRSLNTEEVDTIEPKESKQEKRKHLLEESEKSSDSTEEIEPQLKKKPEQDNGSTVTETSESSLSNDSSTPKRILRRKRSFEPISIIRKKLHGKKSKTLNQNQKPESEISESSKLSDQDYSESDDVKMKPAVEDISNEIRRRCKFITRSAKKDPSIDSDPKFKSRYRQFLRSAKNVKPEVEDINEEVAKPDETKKDHISKLKQPKRYRTRSYTMYKRQQN